MSRLTKAQRLCAVIRYKAKMIVQIIPHEEAEVEIRGLDINASAFYTHRLSQKTHIATGRTAKFIRQEVTGLPPVDYNDRTMLCFLRILGIKKRRNDYILVQETRRIPVKYSYYQKAKCLLDKQYSARRKEVWDNSI